eukprot:jgi/Psemu1/9393/gm1.9393_g
MIGILFCFVSLELDIGNAFVVTPPVHLVPKFRIFRSDKPNILLKLAAESYPEPDDTVRVRIWRALASSFGEEITLKELGAIVGERRVGELRSHLQHVEKQSKTLKNKSPEWKERRGLSDPGMKGADNARIRIRRGKKNEMYVKLD